MYNNYEKDVYTMKSSGAPTMKDVAREAGVSLGTVSKVINGIHVGDIYKEKVEKAAKKLGYQVNNYARGLKTNQTNTAAVLIPSLYHPFFAAIAEEVTAALTLRGRRAMLMITNYDNEAEKKCIAMVRQNKVDGIIALTYNPDLEVEDDIPFVTIDRRCGSNIPCVSSDNFGGGELAASKLLELGCKKLVYMRIGSMVPSEADKRGAGFESVCRARRVDFDSVILNDEDTHEPFFRYLEAHIKGGQPDFDGIFCNTDRLAAIIISRLAQMGVKIPEQVQIIGYDGIVDFATGEPYCSTIVQPIRQMAETAVNIMLNSDGAPTPALISLPVKYSASGTTRA